MSVPLRFITRLSVGVVFFILLLIGSFWWLLSPVESQSVPLVRFVVPKGQALVTIASRLEEQKIVKSAVVFRIVAQFSGVSKQFQAGSFELDPSKSAWEVAQQLTEGTDDIWITIVEGWRVEEIADMLARQELTEFDRQLFLDLAKEKEGYLFPDTYLIPRLSTAEDIFYLLSNTFEKKVEMGLVDQFSESKLTPEEVIVLASIVEREAKGYEQSRLVAGILLNRLEINMALQVDATLQYIKGYSKSEETWWPTPFSQDKQLDSPFNTYKNPGLPPKPIANPSLDAVRAVLNPVESSDLYYIHDIQGKLHTAETFAEHTKNVEQYLR